MSRFFSKDLASVRPYTPGEQPQDMKYIKLNTNESPYSPSKKAIAFASEAAKRLNLYPDPTGNALIQALAETYSVHEAQIILGNGSDEILFFAFAAFCGQTTPAVFPNITYGFYKVFAGLCHTPYREIPLNDDLTVNVQEYVGAHETIFIANPNAPTGIALPLSAIEAIVKGNPDHVVVVDEAYVDFGGSSAVPLIDTYDNLLVIQTFSKSRAMAGARLGMGFASAALIRDLNAVKYSLNPYNVNAMTLAAGLGTLADGDYTRDCCQKVMETRAYTAEKLSELGFVFPESCTNFIFARHEKISGKEIYRQLKRRGILVRHFDGPFTDEYNRITIGSRPQMDALIEALASIRRDAL